MNNGEFAIVDNAGFVETGIKNIPKALSTLKALKKDKDFTNGGRLTVLKIVGTYDNYMAGNPEYIDASGLPIADR